MEYKISNDQFIIEYEGFRIIMELKEKFFAQYLKSLAPEQWGDLLTADHSFWEYCACREKFNSRDWRKLVQYDNDSSSCTAWNQSRNGNFICNRYKRWVNLP